MNKHKFTQGPYTILPEEVDKDYIRIRGTMVGGRWKIANVLTPVYEGVPPREAEETRANARLLAASWEMHRQLETLLQDIEEGKFINLEATGVCIRALLNKIDTPP